MYGKERWSHIGEVVCVARGDGATQGKECVCGKERWSHIGEEACVRQGGMEPHKGRSVCVARRDGAT